MEISVFFPDLYDDDDLITFMSLSPIPSAIGSL